MRSWLRGPLSDQLRKTCVGLCILNKRDERWPHEDQCFSLFIHVGPLISGQVCINLAFIVILIQRIISRSPDESLEHCTEGLLAFVTEQVLLVRDEFWS